MSFFQTVLRLIAAMASGALIGFERGKHGRAAGLRTHMLVAVGSAMASLVGLYLTAITSKMGDPSRIASGVVTGVGFIGAGIIILKGGNKVTGLTTAAALWATATVGLAYGAGFFTAGIFGTLLIFSILTIMSRFEVNQKKDCLFFIKIDDVAETNSVFAKLKEMFPNSHSEDVLPAKSGIASHVGLTVNISDENESSSLSVEETVKQIPHVVFIVKE